MTTVLVTSRSFSSGRLDLSSELAAAGASVVLGRTDHELVALRPQLAHTTAWIAGVAPITAAHLDAAPRLQLIARYGVGVEGVDLAAAAQRGITVTNTPGANSGAVADHTLALILALLRRVPRDDRLVRDGHWRAHRVRELGSLTVGVIGVGRIGREVARRLAGFNATLLGYDPEVSAGAQQAAGLTPVTLPELTARSDLVTLHSPGGTTLIDAEWLGAARTGVSIVNTARASLVDEQALADALATGRVGGYAADTLASESGPALVSPLLDPALADVTVFTPHTAAQTVEAVDKMGRGATDAVLALLRGEVPPNVVPGRRP